jgi:hypothetical protein
VGYRDVEYLGTATVVELDGRLGHEWQQDRWHDLDRDVDAAVAGDLTIRLGWQQEGPRMRCGLADLRSMRADIGGSPAPGAGNAPTSVARPL